MIEQSLTELTKGLQELTAWEKAGRPDSQFPVPDHIEQSREKTASLVTAQADCSSKTAAVPTGTAGRVVPDFSLAFTAAILAALTFAVTALGVGWLIHWIEH